MTTQNFDTNTPEQGDDNSSNASGSTTFDVGDGPAPISAPQPILQPAPPPSLQPIPLPPAPAAAQLPPSAPVPAADEDMAVRSNEVNGRRCAGTPRS